MLTNSQCALPHTAERLFPFGFVYGKHAIRASKSVWSCYDRDEGTLRQSHEKEAATGDLQRRPD